MEDMDIDDYSRDRSRSPVRERSRSPAPRKESFSKDSRDSRGSRESRDSRGSRDSYSSRDYGYSRGRYGGDRRGGSDFGRRDTYRRGGYRGGRDYGSRRDYNSSPYSGGSDEYRTKTERNYDNSIFVGNIPFGCSSKDVEEIFKGDLDIVRADIVTNRGQSRGMATVEFSNKDDVRKAISKYDHHEYRGREIFVRQDYPPPGDKKKDVSQSKSSELFSRSTTYSERNDRFSKRAPQSREKFQPPAPKPGTEIFVGNLPFSINWQALKDLMRKAGEVVRADVRTDNWGKSRGFGTVVFSTEEEAARAVEEFQGFEIEGRQLDTRPGRVYSQERNSSSDIVSSNSNEKPEASHENTEFTENVTGDGEKSNTIFASNLPWVTNVDDLYELFETIGRVTKAEIQYNESGKPSGNAVIQFELEELAELAITNLDNYNYGGRDLKISYASRL